ncbi:MAG: RNA polymerase sigma factor, partial [Nocardioides sp.]
CLALRTLCGLTTAEVARALLVPESTMAKRLTRAKQKIKLARIPYRVPSAEELPRRWAGVLTTTYLTFNEGYAASSGPELIRQALVDETIRLGRLLVRLRPDEPGAIGLLALMLLQDSRRAARVDRAGHAVLLAEQDRRRWDGARIAEGVALTARGLALTPDAAHPYVVQAAIAGVHALAASYAETDWDAIISWYDVLLGIEPSPVVELNRAAAVAERDGPGAGLALIDRITGLEGYALWHASRAMLLDRLGRAAEARAARHRAGELDLNAPLRGVLTARLS